MSFFSHLEFQPKDEFNDIRLKLANDSNPYKIDVSAGVYRDQTGKSFELPVVKKAKEYLQANDMGHDYNFCLGILEFVQPAAKIAVGEATVEGNYVSSCQTIGGTGACHLAVVFLTKICGYKDFYLGIPAWPNYFPLIQQMNGNVNTYRYYDPVLKCVDFKAFAEALNNASPNSVFVLQLCCQNPTAADLNLDQWTEVAVLMKKKSLIPMFDAAYQGFATGSRYEDGLPIRIFIEMGLEVLVCQSFSKSLGLYAERVGCLHVVSNDPERVPLISDQLRYIFRAECSSSPAYGARLMSIISNDNLLLSQWDKDLKGITNNLVSLREKVYQLLTEKYKTPGTWEHIKEQKGLFWFSGLTQEQSKALMDKYHVYLPSNGRVNIAGLNDRNIDAFCNAFDKTIRNSPSSQDLV